MDTIREIPVYLPGYSQSDPQVMAGRATLAPSGQITIDIKDSESGRQFYDLLASVEDLYFSLGYRVVTPVDDAKLQWAVDLLDHMRFYTERNLEIGTPVDQIVDDGNLYLRDRNVLIGSKDASGGEKNFDYDKASKGERSLWALEQFRVMARLSSFYREALLLRFLQMAKQILG